MTVGSVHALSHELSYAAERADDTSFPNKLVARFVYGARGKLSRFVKRSRGTRTRERVYTQSDGAIVCTSRVQAPRGRRSVVFVYLLYLSNRNIVRGLNGRKKKIRFFILRKRLRREFRR